MREAGRRRIMLTFVHRIAGVLAILMIGTFWTATALSELFAPPETIAAVKTAIPWGFLILIPALATTGGSGLTLARERRAGLIRKKTRRMQIVAANGLLILLPAALFLAVRARAAVFDPTFYAVQAVELAAGLVNISLLGLNLRDGFTMSRRRRIRRHD